MKGLGPLGISHAFDLDHREAKLRERIAVRPRGNESRAIQRNRPAARDRCNR